MALHNMRQDREETIRAFGARLRGQAGVCKFMIKCSACEAEVNYTEAILRDVLCHRLDDPEIQLDLLGDKNQDMTLEQVFLFVEAKEAGKRSASRLLTPQGADALVSSSYRHRRNESLKGQPSQAKNPPPQTKNPETRAQQYEICSFCGRKGHGRGAPTRVRRRECPAYGLTCRHCGRDNHLEHMCRSKGTAKADRPGKVGEHESAIFDSLCEVTATGRRNNKKSIALDHHLYNQLSDTWVRRPSKPQPFIKLSTTALRGDYEHLGFSLSATPKPALLHAMADTGCQSCLASIKIINRLGLKRDDLIPVTMKMHAANDNGITILGAAILRFSGKDYSGNKVETRQITYVTDNSDKLFLSREACIALGMITADFPTIGETANNQSKAAAIGPADTKTPHHMHTDTRSDSGLTTDAIARDVYRHPHPQQIDHSLQQRRTAENSSNTWLTTTNPAHSTPASTSHSH